MFVSSIFTPNDFLVLVAFRDETMMSNVVGVFNFNPIIPYIVSYAVVYVSKCDSICVHRFDILSILGVEIHILGIMTKKNKKNSI